MADLCVSAEATNGAATDSCDGVDNVKDANEDEDEDEDEDEGML
jgi:hypothetical protein